MMEMYFYTVLLHAFVFLACLALYVASSDNLQCACVLKPGTTDCLQYDSKYQAVTLQEAISSFVDMTLEEEQVLEKAEENMLEHEKCHLGDCKVCEKKLRQKLSHVGLLNEFVDELGHTLNTSEICTKYRFTRPHEKGIYAYRKSGQDKQKDITLATNPPTSSGQSSDESSEGKRKRRQTSLVPAIVGTRFNLSCVLKGASADANGLLSLCSKCWAWRQLPPNYFPQFLNEMVCDDADSGCLSGFASCSAGTRTVEVIRNDTVKLTTVTLTAGSFCECKVKIGSSLQALVTGSSVNSFPSLSVPTTR